MKRTILLIVWFMVQVTVHAQEKNIALSLGSSYTQQVYFQLGSNNQITLPTTDWDLAFLRKDARSFATRVNDARIKVYEAANAASDWNSIDVSKKQQWKKLYNSEVKWEKGAFDNGSATYGWGEYFMPTHHVVGSIIFVLEYDDGTLMKFMIEDYFKGYTCKYAIWEGTSWSSDRSFTILNSTGEGKMFNYYSLKNNKLVDTIPLDADWDLLFTKYTSFYKNIDYVSVTGALQNTHVAVAKKLEGDQTELQNENFKKEINTIGDRWKELSGYSYVIPKNKYYVKTEKDQTTSLYELWFTDFGGAATGTINFTYKKINNLGIEELTDHSSFTVYPNPIVNKTATLLYDIKNSNANKAELSIYSLSGKKMYEDKILGQAGFYSKELNLSALTPGIYILVFKVGDHKATKKIIVK
ncbi:MULTISPECIES: T9SS type A sorting domain-containing protein [unclassified Apibacter]|uniref:T9SS type A sorting domain-containing protein n=1 Tax=unclassified Apibacter TaxID=2630820 RepID=UPI001324F30A|nr:MULTISPECIES: T9SS type A sorting domain-containing protein [unclassified Apibacter]MCX8677909.1 T9SS type A sorting domain-containing protein [Apibacter sp. B3919]MXO25138.1 T9SS type A sorting domain-containing protein [Apibacter sp. B3924]MXO27341.1 T9SS type A sorting domain-containing protein [Apibacter sp. B3813]MXO29154.1 T9SS type A sorting domain-containing protein [Apibacter sp. B3913]MXO31343.1 T9SS type A sorting domain-containing protein [Apibacter sp. B3912]